MSSANQCIESTSVVEASDTDNKAGPAEFDRKYKTSNPTRNARPSRAFLGLRVGSGIASLALLIGLTVNAQFAEASQPAAAKALVVYSDNGGRLSKYAVDVHNAKAQNTRVLIKGKCQSACTLYLSMPYDQICISRGASFVFHKAYGSSARLNNWGTQYLMAQYPIWVRNWIQAKGGLSHGLIQMNYEYASQFLPSCSQRPSQTTAGIASARQQNRQYPTTVDTLEAVTPNLVARVASNSDERDLAEQR